METVNLFKMDTIPGETIFPFSLFSPFLNEDQLLKERICSSRSKFFPLRVYPFKQGFYCP